MQFIFNWIVTVTAVTAEFLSLYEKSKSTMFNEFNVLFLETAQVFYVFLLLKSLANIDEVVARIRMRIRKLDDEIRGSIRSQTDSESNGKQVSAFLCYRF